MARNVDLLEGSIVGSLTSLALPIMATSLIQMAYNMTDMIWIGRLSADAVAAVGAAGMYLWLANGLAMIPRLGGQVKVAHELGAQAPERAAGYGQAAFHLGALLVILFTAMCILLNGPLIAFFKLNSPQVNSDARVYLVIVALGFLFSFFNQIFTGLFTAMGSSVVVLRSTAVGLVGNILLDPLMIFGVGPFPRMEVAGAAAATVLAQAIVTAMFLLAARRETTLFPHIHPFRPSQGRAWLEMLRIGLPVSIQSMFFFQPLHVHRADRGRLGGRRHCRSKGGHPDRIHLLYHSGGLRHRSKRLYCPELRCPQTGPYLPGILDGRGNDRRMELFYHRYAGGVPRTSGTGVHPEGRGGPHRRKLSAYHGLFSDPHVPGDHLLRCLPGSRAAHASDTGRGHRQRCPHPHGHPAQRHRAGTGWRVVEHQHFQHCQGPCGVCLVRSGPAPLYPGWRFGSAPVHPVRKFQGKNLAQGELTSPERFNFLRHP